ncbi:hypothetical protein CAOG_05564 [Capsaspora owczarzaki ATCC 30864]|uniref:CHY-type domain-containing protein n=1 Tax=Capsaspora owczarzaki (strain ATCC 30864) TaxID=595528 RepID=A0A0D2UIW2_CAPO3|nr:hypothetical protein CAOG_05564 [Capsaspora owczarzaki ATCC 30864]KJE95071.1 hypothetical protein CAOG_005564 [Capsaspora owczarzaki ATCC 30864]|eukprot:XP_004346237.1 hypothetical protein CAOG_05564 [Capsaspora owczarzaki ATCC 30864]
MCKHVLNAQVSVRAACCKKWFDCPECHAGSEQHPLRKTVELVFACKKCKKVFRKNSTNFDEETDSYCPYCDNKYILPASSKVPVVTLQADVSALRDMRDPTAPSSGHMRQPDFEMTAEELAECNADCCDDGTCQ